MKRIITIICSILFSIAVNAQTTWYYQSGDAAIESNWNDVAVGGGNVGTAGIFSNSSDIFDLNGKSSITISTAWTLNGTLLNSGVSTSIFNVTNTSGMVFNGDVQNGDKMTCSNCASINYHYTSTSVDIIPGTYTNALVIRNDVTGVAKGNIIAADVETTNSASVLDMATFTLNVTLDNLISGNNGSIKTQNTSAAPITLGSGNWKQLIAFNANGTQTVPTSAEYTGGLSIEGNTSSAKTISGNLTIGTSLNIDGLLEMGTHQLLESTTTISTITGSGKFETKNTSTTPFPSGKNWGDILMLFNATSGSTEYLPAGSYHSIGQVAANNTILVQGDIFVENQIAEIQSRFDMQSFQLTGGVGFTFATFGSNSTFRTANTSTTPYPSGLTFGTGSQVSFYAAANQTIPSGTYASLNIDGTGRKTASGNITVNSFLAFGSSANSLDLSTFQLLGGPITKSFGSTHSIKTQNTSSTPIPSGETWPAEIIIEFDANADQTVPIGTYNGPIELLGSGTKSAAGNITAIGLIFDDVTLDMKTFKLIPAALGFTDLVVNGANPTLRTAFAGDFPIPEDKDWTAFNMIFEADGPQKVNVGKCTNLTIGGGTGFPKKKTLTREAEITGTLTIENNCWLESGSNNISDTYQLLGNFIIAGGGTFSTTYLDSPDRIKDPIPQGLDWSSLDVVRYDNNAERLVGGTFSKIFLNGQGNNHFTTGNIVCTELRTLNEDLEILPGNYIIANEVKLEGTSSSAGSLFIFADNTGYGQLKTPLLTSDKVNPKVTKQFYINAIPSERWVDMSTALTGANLSNLAESGAKIVFDVEGIGSAFEWDATVANWVQSSASGNDPTHGNRIFMATDGSDIFLRDGSGTVSENAADFQTTTTSRDMYYNDGQSTTATFVGGTGLTDTEGWNFIANPFLANYDWDAAVGSLNSDIRGVYYVWNGTNYVNRNAAGVGAAGQYIAPGQGFWIQVEPTWSSSDPFPLDIANVDPTGSGSFLKTSGVEDFVSIQVSEVNGSFQDEVFMQFSPILSDDFEAGFDAVNMMNATNVPNLSIPGTQGQFSTFATSDENKSYPLNFSDEEDRQQLQFSINDEALLSHNYVYIEDVKTGAITELSNDGIYEFINDVNYKEDRFVIHFGNKRSDIPLESGESFFAYLTDNDMVININSSSLAPVSLSVTDIQGRTILSEKMEMSDEIRIENLNLSKGVYIISLSQSGNFLGTQKIMK
jgi:hypothetical protein